MRAAPDGRPRPPHHQRAAGRLSALPSSPSPPSPQPSAWTRTTLIDRLARLRQDGVLTRFGPFYDAERARRRLLPLAAMAVPAERFEAVAAHVNAHPEVAHNYAREHALNMWFVLATETPERDRERSPRSRPKPASPCCDLPKLEEFFVGAEGGGMTPDRPPSTARIVEATQGGAAADRAALRRRSRRQLGLDDDGGHGAPGGDAGARGHPPHRRRAQPLRARATRQRHVGLGRRRRARSPSSGAQVGALDFVSHCYRRPRMPPAWPYNLFAMVHGRTRDEVEDQVRRDRRAARRGGARPRRPLLHPHPEEDRPAPGLRRAA